MSENSVDNRTLAKIVLSDMYVKIHGVKYPSRLNPFIGDIVDADNQKLDFSQIEELYNFIASHRASYVYIMIVSSRKQEIAHYACKMGFTSNVLQRANRLKMSPLFVSQPTQRWRVGETEAELKAFMELIGINLNGEYFEANVELLNRIRKSEYFKHEALVTECFYGNDYHIRKVD